MKAQDLTTQESLIFIEGTNRLQDQRTAEILGLEA